MASQPPPDPNLMRRDMQAMLSFIQGARIVSMARETAVSQVQGWLLGRYWWSMFSTAASVAVILLASWPTNSFVTPHQGFLCGIVLLLFVARIGALISIGRRIKDEDIGASVGADAIYALATLGSGINGLAIALMSSNAFGLVMYALFASGLPAALGISGGIAPTFQLTIAELHTRMMAAEQEVNETRTALEACLAKPTTAAAGPASAGAPEIGGIDNGVEAAGDNIADPDATDTPAAATNTGVAAPPAPSCDDLQVSAKSARDYHQTASDAFYAAKAREARQAQPIGTPAQQRDRAGDAGQDSILGALRYGLGLSEISDLFKLLIWAFIAGFFESLVPDMLDALAKRGEASKEKK